MSFNCADSERYNDTLNRGTVDWPGIHTVLDSHGRGTKGG